MGSAVMSDKKVVEIHRYGSRHWVGDGFPVRNLIPGTTVGDQLSPFLLLDYAGPEKFGPTDSPRGVGEHPQMQALRTGTEVIIACPGRLLDLMQRRCADFSHLQYLVLDEADRMLDMGFLPDIIRIIEQLPEDRQTLDYMLAPQEMGRPFFAPPDVPPARVAALREAFMKTLRDPDFLRDADKAGVETQPTTGEAVAALLARAYATPPDIVEKARIFAEQ